MLTHSSLFNYLLGYVLRRNRNIYPSEYAKQLFFEQVVEEVLQISN